MLEVYLPFNVLERTHVEYEHLRSVWETIKELREGAPSILKNVKRYVPQKQDETANDYQDRLSKFAYTPVMATAVKDTAARLSSAPVYVNYKVDELAPVVNYLREHNDSKGKRDERTLLQDILLELLYYGRVYIAADRKPPETEPRSKAEEANLTLPYLNILSALNVVDWDDDEEWFKVRSIDEVKTPTESGFVCRWTFYLKGAIQVFEAPVQVQDGRISKVWDGNQFVAPTKKGLKIGSTVKDHGADNTLVSCTTLPPELWVGALCYLKQVQHMCIESGWTDAGSVAGSIQRVFTPTPPTVNDNPEYLVGDPEYDKVALGNRSVLVGASFQYVESQGLAIRNLTDQMMVIEQQIKDIVSMKFAAGQASVTSASGVAMAIDQTQLINVMRDYGSRVRGLYQDALQTLLVILGLPTEALSVAGLSDFTIDNVKEGLADAMTVSQLAEFIPVTAQRLYWQKISKLLTGTVAPDDELQISRELDTLFGNPEINPTNSTPNTTSQGLY